MQRVALLASLCLVVSVACGGADETSTEDPATEAAAYDHGASTVESAQAALRTADLMFDFDPTLDAAATPEANAENVRAHVDASLPAGCTVSASGTTVTVTFGPPPGCTVNGMQLTGTVVVSLSKSGGATTAAVTFTDVTVDGVALAGTATFVTSNGSTFAVTVAITRGDRTTTANLQVVGAAGAYTVSGQASVTIAGATSAVTFTQLHYTKGDCYPDGGQVTVAQGPVTQTMTFTASSADTGVVTVTTGRRTSTKTLPAYGSCPSTAS